MTNLAFVFPGQGSQSVGMLGELAQAHGEVRETFEQASDAVGVDLWRLSQEGPEDQLNQTANTQPALLAAGIAVWRVWNRQGGPKPAQMAGHSLGEYTALVASGAMEFSAAARLVAERGRLMQNAVADGAGLMAAVLGLDDDVLTDLCERGAEGQVVSPANLNAPGQVVIAGDRTAVERVVELARAEGARKVVPLAVSVPSHCGLMKEAADRLAERLADVDIAPPRLPVLHNADVQSHDNGDAIRDALVRQLYQPVRWVETIRSMSEQGAEHIIECGPGKVLAGLNRRIERSMGINPVFDDASLAKALGAVSG